MFDDLRDGGVLALTVPFDLGTNFTFGHCNSFSPLGLLYNLVLAGFDCREASVKCYNYNIGILVRKKYNGITRRMSFGVKPNTPEKQEIVRLGDRQMPIREIIGGEIYDDLAASFPFPVTGDTLVWKSGAINWGTPFTPEGEWTGNVPDQCISYPLGTAEMNHE